MIADAKRLIAAKSPEGLRVLGAGVSKPCSPVRYNNAALVALNDQLAGFTPEERELIASFIEEEEEPDRRDYTLRIRLTEHERECLFRAAEQEGMTVSEYIRRPLDFVLMLEEPSNQGTS